MSSIPWPFPRAGTRPSLRAAAGRQVRRWARKRQGTDPFITRLRPGRVYLVEPRSIPMTANGKLKHAALQASYLDGSLRAEGKILHPEY